MLRRAATGLLARPILGAKIRPFATDLSASAETPNAYFIDAWKKFIPNVDPPKTPLSFMRPRPPTGSSIPTKLIVNLVLPYASELSGKEVDMVIIPAITGHMGILPGHEPIITELKPGVLSLQEGSEVTEYFVSSGFAFVHANSCTDIIAVEAVPLDNLDASLVQKGLAEFNQKLSSATTELEIAEAKIGIVVHSALNAALTG